jgi:hypothetical protein
MTETELVMTEFNSSIATLQRIDIILRRCERSSFDEDLISYSRHLRNLRKEAIVKMKHTGRKGKCEKDCVRCECDSKFNAISNNVELIMNHPDSNVRTHLFRQLDDFEVFLRQFMDKKGMLIKENYDRGL